MKYQVTVTSYRTQIIQVDAENGDEAYELVATGEYTDNDIVDDSDDAVEITSIKVVDTFTNRARS